MISIVCLNSILNFPASVWILVKNCTIHAEMEFWTELLGENVCGSFLENFPFCSWKTKRCDEKWAKNPLKKCNLWKFFEIFIRKERESRPRLRGLRSEEIVIFYTDINVDPNIRRIVGCLYLGIYKLRQKLHENVISVIFLVRDE